VLDFASLYPETAQPYSTCFDEGAWYRRGFPGPTPPADGVATCVRDSNEWSTPASEGCWGRCTSEDVVTSGGRDLIVAVTQAVASEASELLAVASASSALQFTSTTGNPSTRRTMESKGYTSSSRCASDCQTTSFVAVDDTYCSAGVAGDVVLSVTKPPRYAGVAGSGSSCSVDSFGRPLWLVFAWLERMDDKRLGDPNCGGGSGTCYTLEEVCKTKTHLFNANTPL